jgi:hypothetical protein
MSDEISKVRASILHMGSIPSLTLSYDHAAVAAWLGEGGCHGPPYPLVPRAVPPLGGGAPPPVPGTGAYPTPGTPAEYPAVKAGALHRVVSYRTVMVPWATVEMTPAMVVCRSHDMTLGS